ncbi:MAG: gamma carbonic anhydrase family protein [Actinobacteria bacterium]|nr:MAG: gamma carbonic anhydrase family protein [Actinomycetota bacterium]
MQPATPRIDPTAFVADTARVLGDVTIGRHVVVMFGAVLRAEFDRITVGERTNVQDNSVLHVDEGVPCHVGSDVIIGHAAVVHGATVGNHCLIGIGACALNRSIVGEGAWLGAGSVLSEGAAIPPWTLAVGTPARPIRELTEADIQRQRRGVADYQRIGEAYRALQAP